jgi:adenosylcobinamide-phosphate synthase
MPAALIALLTAFALDVVWGDPPNRFHPVVGMGSLIRWTERKINAGGVHRRFWLGAVSIILGAGLFSLPWLVVQGWLADSPAWLNGVLTGFLLKPVFAFRSLLKASREVRQALTDDDLPGARRLVAWHLVSRDTASLSLQQVSSAVIESLAENLTDSFLAPLLCFCVGGLPLAWCYRYINTADAMIGYRTGELEYFGKFAARLDDVLNWIPARLAGLLLTVAASLTGLDGKKAWRTMLSQHARTSSPNAGWTMAAAAGALGVTLEKAGCYSLQGGGELPQAIDIQRAEYLTRFGLLLSLLLSGGIILVL